MNTNPIISDEVKMCPLPLGLPDTDINASSNVKICPLRLKFSDKKIEHAFTQKSNRDNILKTRIGLFLTIFLFIFYGTADIYIYPSNVSSLLIIRSIEVLILSSFIVYSFRPKYIQRLQQLNFALMIITGLLLLSLFSFEVETDYVVIFFASYTLFMTGSFISSGLLFFNALIINLLFLPLMLVLVSIQVNTESFYLFFLLFFSTLVLTAQGSYFAELDKRKLYIKELYNQKIQKALIDQKDLYELVFANTKSGVFITKIDNNQLLDCNDAAVSIFKYPSKEEVLKLKLAELSPELQFDGEQSSDKFIRMKELAIRNSSHTFEWQHYNFLGEIIWIEVVLTPIILEDEKVLYVVIKDINHKKEAEAQLQENQILLLQQARYASMGEMIGNIAHQWRQPLNTLGLITQKLSIYEAKGMLDSKRLDTSVDKSMQLINTMSNTIDDFRDFFSPNKNQSTFVVAEAIEKSHAIIESFLEHNNIQYHLDISEPELAIKGFENEFSQVMINLLNNSKDALLQHHIAKPAIDVKVYQEANGTYIEVSDNGGGIKADDLQKIFEPYFTTKEEGKGTGIGLYMSKSIIEEHMKGKLTAFNTDQGACFQIWIPLLEEITNT